MFRHLKTYLEFGNHFCGVEHTSQHGVDILFTTVLKKAKNNLDIEAIFNSSSIENIVEKLPKKQHVFLVINNDQVLTKKIENQQTELIKLVYTAFPNINLDDFYYEVITNDTVHFVSICRRTYVDTLLTTYKEHALYIIGISLGNLIVSSCTGFVSYNSIITSNSKVTIENKGLTSIDPAEPQESSEYDLNGLPTNSNHLLSLCAALVAFLDCFQSATNFDSIKQSLTSDYRQTRLFMMSLKFGLVFILTMLLINFFVFNYYFNAVNSLQQTSQMNQTTKQAILVLNERVNKSQKMVEDMLKSNSSRSSFFINAIVQDLPNSILLSELNYQPVSKNIKSGQAIEINSNIILISGESNDSDLFSKWLTSLESINWVQHVEILSYGDISKSTSNFSLKLTISHD